MINWASFPYTINHAAKDFGNLKVLPKGLEPITTPDSLVSIRDALIKAREDIFDQEGFDGADKLDYKFDLLFGLKLYEILSPSAGFNDRAASSDDIWRLLSIKVVPDIVHARWSLNADRYYKQSRRIWLKAMWWYIHLSWQGTPEKTLAILQKNTTDTVVQLVERPGLGYHVEMYRELMKQYAEYEDTSRNLFRQVMKLNTAQLLIISPELIEGEIPSYVQDLFVTAGGRDYGSNL